MSVRRDGRVGLLLAGAGALALAVGCGEQDPVDAGRMEVDQGPPPVDAGPPDLGQPDQGDPGPPCDGPPGLFIDGSCVIFAAGVRFYEPRYQLWSDDTDKERYVFLPEGRQIDTTDADGWIFPAGTRLYKSFSIDGVRLETRLFEKRSDNPGFTNWDMRVFQWNEAQNGVVEVGTTVLENVMGTNHDIPDQRMCVRCHSGGADAVNGFGALTLNHDGEGVTLATLNDEGWLTSAIPLGLAEAPGSDEDREVLGYAHINCGICHNENGDGGASGLLQNLPIGLATVEESPFYETAVDEPSGWGAPAERITPGDPEGSTIVRRMRALDPANRMPPIGTEVADEEALGQLVDWINGLAD